MKGIRGRLGWAMAAGLAVGSAMAIWPTPSVSLAFKLLTTALTVLTAWRPAWGLAVLAATLPLGLPLLVLSGARDFGLDRFAECWGAAVVAGACAAQAWRGGVEPTRTATPVAVALVVFLTGGLVASVMPHAVAGWPAFVRALIDHAGRHWWADYPSFTALHDGLLWVTAVALVGLTERVARQAREHARLIVNAARWGLTGLAALSILRFVELTLMHPESLETARRLVLSARLSPQLPDVNATASWLVLGVVLWASQGWSTRGWARARAVSGVLVTVAALWLTGSRAGQAAALVTLGLAGVAAVRTPAIRWASAAVVAAAMAAIVFWNPGRHAQSGAGEALGVRGAMTSIAVRLSATAPVFGLGPGRFADASIPYVGPELAARFPQTRVGENAHNQALQLLVEWGAVGLLVIGWIVASALGAGVRAGGDARGWAAAWIAFAASALLGHPWLLPTVLLSTVPLLGAMAAAGPAGAGPTRLRWVWTAVVWGLVVALPWRATDALRATDLDHYHVGASRLAGELDGVPYHLAQPHSTWFVRVSARVIEIPVRAEQAGRTCALDIRVDGHPANAVSVTGDEWTRVRFSLTAGKYRQVNRRIELTAAPVDCGLRVGRFTILD